MINVNTSSKRTAADARSDLEEVLEEDAFKKMITWLEGEFMANARVLQAGGKTSVVQPENEAKKPSVTNNTPASSHMAEESKTSLVQQAISMAQEARPSPQKSVNSQHHQSSEQKKIVQDQSNNLSKRPPERKVEEEKKTSIHDRIRINKSNKEEAKPDNGSRNKKWQGPKYEKEQHPYHRYQEGNGEEAGHLGDEEAKRPAKESPEEEAERQARLEVLLSAAKKVFSIYPSEKGAFSSQAARTLPVNLFILRRTALGSRSACSESLASTSTQT